MVNLRNFTKAQRKELNDLAQLDVGTFTQKFRVSTEDAQRFKNFILEEQIKTNNQETLRT